MPAVPRALAHSGSNRSTAECIQLSEERAAWHSAAQRGTAQGTPPTDHEGQELEDGLRLLLLRVVALGRGDDLLGDELQRTQGVAGRAVDEWRSG